MTFPLVVQEISLHFILAVKKKKALILFLFFTFNIFLYYKIT